MVAAAIRGAAGIAGGLGGRRAAERAGEHAGKVAQAQGMFSYGNFGPNSEMNQMKGYILSDMRTDPEQRAKRNAEFSKRMFADSMNLMAQRGQQNMISRGFENMTDSQTGLQRAVLSRMMSPQAQMFADNMAGQLESAHRYRTALAQQEYGRGQDQFDRMAGMMGQSSAAGSGNPMLQGVFAGGIGAMNYLDSRAQLSQANKMQNRYLKAYERDRFGYSGAPV